MIIFSRMDLQGTLISIFTYKGATSVKAINLLSLLSAKFDLNDKNFTEYIEQFGINPRIRASEIDDMKSLVQGLLEKEDKFDIFNNYYVGFIINRIGKEFDLLKFGENGVINIELKRKSDEEKITKQLIQNQHYLKFLDVEVHSFTYISSTKKLYTLVDSNHIEEIDFSVLIDKLRELKYKEIDDLDNLFDPTNYLVSPSKTPEAFIEDKYFLSAQQSTFKREILNLQPTEKSVFITIKGGPGTGKTLLTFDIAKEYIKKSKNILIFNCGKLNKGHFQLIQKYQWPIEPITNLSLSMTEREDNLNEYDLIIFDEAQRMYKNKFFNLIQRLQNLKVKCIFSFDPDQCLTTYEIENNVPKLIDENLNPYKYELTNIIRHNKEIHAFINNLFDLSKRAQIQDYSNISIQYFSSKKATKSYLQYLKNEGWKIIDYTITRYIENPDNYHLIKINQNTQEGSEEEFDNVVAVIDEYFYYMPNHKLSTKDSDNKLSYYHPTRMLFQNISRARKKLHIVVINNPVVLDKILRILNG